MYSPNHHAGSKYKSPITHRRGKYPNENSELCTQAKETALQIGRASTVRRASAQQSYQKVEEM